jgi:hypothetical protein
MADRNLSTNLIITLSDHYVSNMIYLNLKYI